MLVVLSLRGGFDGLSAVVPAADPSYASARPGIGVPTGALLPLDATFGLHPALAPLKPLWDAGQLAAVHAVGQPDPTRSHFRAMEEMERAAPGSSLRTGWLDRVSSAQGAGSAFATVGIGVEANQQALVGPAPALLMPGLDDFAALQRRQRDRARPVDQGARRDARRRPAGRRRAGPARAPRPRHRRGACRTRPARRCATPTATSADALRDVARLVKAGVGLRVATVDFGDWDMHVGLGRVDGGWMARQLADLGQALAAFAADLGPDLARVSARDAVGVRPPGAGERVRRARPRPRQPDAAARRRHRRRPDARRLARPRSRRRCSTATCPPPTTTGSSWPRCSSAAAGWPASQVFPRLGSARLGLARPR